MTTKKNVLIFPAGAENALEIYDSLKYNVHIQVYGASGKSDYARYAYPANHYFEGDLYINDSDFNEKFNQVLQQFSIDYVIPAHDTIALYLKENEMNFIAQIICSPYETAKIARSKKKIYENLKEYSFIPWTTCCVNEISEYPVFMKPDIGEGAKGTKLLRNQEEAKQALTENPDSLICEYLPGEELTVDCFTDSKRNLLFAGARTRERITMGISFCSKNVSTPMEVRDIAETLNKKFVFRGAWFFQVKKDKNGKFKLMEFSVRQAGTMGLYRQLGVNFALLSVFDWMGYEVSILQNSQNIQLERRLTNSYNLEYEYDTIYLDLDDTLIVENRVNTVLMQLIYQWENDNKSVILLTKHDGQPQVTLKNLKIDPNLFEEIILLSGTESKAEYIKDKKSIFIDNYFPERKRVQEDCGIPVFDVDAIECLLHRDFI